MVRHWACVMVLPGYAYRSPVHPPAPTSAGSRFHRPEALALPEVDAACDAGGEALRASEAAGHTAAVGEDDSDMASGCSLASSKPVTCTLPVMDSWCIRFLSMARKWGLGACMAGNRGACVCSVRAF